MLQRNFQSTAHRLNPSWEDQILSTYEISEDHDVCPVLIFVDRALICCVRVAGSAGQNVIRGLDTLEYS